MLVLHERSLTAQNTRFADEFRDFARIFIDPPPGIRPKAAMMVYCLTEKRCREERVRTRVQLTVHGSFHAHFQDGL